MAERDLANPAAVVEELYDADENVRKEFINAVSKDAVAFAEAFAPLFGTFMNFAKDCEGSTQRGLVGGLMHGVVDDLLTSVKLLLSGKLGPSGNLARQVCEGICMSLMCVHPGPLKFGKDGKEEAHYWELIANDDVRSEGNRSPHQLLMNIEALGINKAGATQLKEALEVHHGHSHAGRLAMANRMDLGVPGKIYFGGHFDKAKLEGYQKELKQRIALCNWAREALPRIWESLKALPKDAATTP